MRKGLFIGVSQYEDVRIPELRYCADDASNLAAAFIKYCSFERNDIRILTTSSEGRYQPTLENILTALSQLRASERSEAFVYYFSGHGLRSTRGLDYLIPKRATLEALDGLSIALPDLIALCSEVNAERTI
jgi:uncharacterized caspase-like protein